MMLDKTLWVHIGPNKTGTSYIQDMLRSNKNPLLEQGYFYPADVRRAYFQHIQHVPLVQALTDTEIHWLTDLKTRRNPRAFKHFMFDSINTPANNIVISSEAFSEPKLMGDPIRIMSEKLLARFRTVKIVAYIRRQDEYMLSNYQERVKKGYTRPFLLMNEITDIENKFADRMAPWRNYFGVENVIIRPFLPSLWKNRNIFHDFLDQIGAPVDLDWEEKPRRNESLDLMDIEIMRRFNIEMGKAFPNQSLEDFRRERRVLLKSMRANYEAPDYTPVRPRLSCEESLLVRDYFSEQNVACLGPELAERFFTIPDKDIENNITAIDIDETRYMFLVLKMAQMINAQAEHGYAQSLVIRKLNQKLPEDQRIERPEAPALPGF